LVTNCCIHIPSLFIYFLQYLLICTFFSRKILLFKVLFYRITLFNDIGKNPYLLNSSNNIIKVTTIEPVEIKNFYFT
jgi:hypothetical protein